MKRGLIAVLVIALAAIAVFFQVAQLPPNYLETVQLQRHMAVINGTARAPLVYRQLSEWAIYVYNKTFTHNQRWHNSFVTFRFFQQQAILLLAFWLYRRWGLSNGAAFWGLAIFTLSCTQSYRNSDLAFNTFTDVALLLCFGLLLTVNADWTIAVMLLLGVVASLNRETFFVPAAGLLWAQWERLNEEHRLGGIVTLGVFLLIQFWLRCVVFPNAVPYTYEHASSLFGFFPFNLRHGAAWLAILGTFNVMLPAIPWLRPGEERRMALVTGGVLVVVMFLAYAQETRVLLPVLAMGMIPATARMWDRAKEL